MPGPPERTTGAEPPGWAVERAREELDDGQDPGPVGERAWELAREAADLEAERHDEYDDPDQGGEG